MIENMNLSSLHYTVCTKNIDSVEITKICTHDLSVDIVRESINTFYTYAVKKSIKS